METSKSVVAVTTSQTLTSSYAEANNVLVALPGFASTNKFIGIEQESEVTVDVFYTTGAAETSNYLNFTLEFSSAPSDTSSWVQETVDDVQSGVNTHTSLEHKIDGAAAGTTYSMSYMRPLCAKSMRIKVKETGVAANYGTVTIRVTITPATGQQYNPTETSLSTGALTIGAVDNNEALVDDAAFTPATSKVIPIGFFADETATDSVNEGDIGAPRMTLNRRPINAGHLLDDSGFGIGTDYVSPMGALVDDTATDSVDEGDVGVPRMSATRVLYTMGSVAHDAVDSGNPHKTGFKAVDPTSLPAAVSALDRVDAIGSLQGETLTYSSRYLFGESSTNLGYVAGGQIGMISTPSASSVYAYQISDVSAALEASTITKATPGVLQKATFRLDSTAGSATYYIMCMNSATLPADGAVTITVCKKIVHTSGTDDVVSWDFTRGGGGGIYHSAGITWCLSSTEFTKTIGGAYLAGSVLAD